MPHSTLVRALAVCAVVVTSAVASATAQTSGDVVLHAQRATTVSGAWSRVADSTAADGVRLDNPDKGLPKLATPLVSPTDYFELTFTPEAGRAYHLWVRGRAQNDSWTNDSVYIQFSGSRNAAGAAAYRIGTTSAVTFSLEESSGAGVSGWGWQDNGYGARVLGDNIFFDGTPQTVRVQAREDGLAIDQIVLSPVTYATRAPGAGKNDTVILADTSSASSAMAWTSLVNTTASGATLTKTKGCGDCADAGAISSGRIASGSVSFTISSGARLVVGLGTDTSASTSYAVAYAFSFAGSSTWEIREGGVYRTEGAFTASDVFKVSAEGTTVKYYRNNALVYTSKTPVTAALVVDASLISLGGSVNIVDFTTSTAPSPPSTGGTSSLAWTSLVKATATGSTLTKTSGCGDCSDAGAVSQQAFTAASAGFTVSSGARAVVGFGTDASTSTSYAIAYAFSFGGTTTWEIREGGAYRTEGPLSASDLFRITSDGTTVRYYRNGALVYTSKAAVPGAMVVDTSLVSLGATVSVGEFAVTTPGTAPAPAPAPVAATLRLLQWNTHHGGVGTDNVYDPNRLAGWIVAMNPDVVMLNEIEKNTSWGNEDQPEVYKNLLQQKTGRTWYYTFAQEFGQWSANGKGNLILSTYPISYSASYELAHNLDRSIALATITVNSRPITLICTHLDPYDATLRLAQAQEVTAWSAPQPENRIVTGDMNAWPDQASIAHFNNYYYDSWTVAQSKGTAVAFAGNNGETKNGRIDYIFSSRNAISLTVQSSQVYDTRDANGYMPSDHRPVVTTFQVK